MLYVDGIRIGEASADGDTPHHIIHRLCEIDMDLAGATQQPVQQGVGFSLKLPDLQQGRHEASHTYTSSSLCGVSRPEVALNSLCAFDH